MINAEGRKKLALTARRYLSGRISNFDLEAREPNSKGDDGITQVSAHGFYELYSDQETHYCTGKHALDQRQRKVVARWLLFLYSSYEYEWPVYKGSIFIRALQVITFSFPRKYFFGTKAFRSAGDFDVWPFLKRSDYEEALRNPPFFNLRRRSDA